MSLGTAATAAFSQGASAPGLIAWAAQEIRRRVCGNGVVVDVGCGQGALAEQLRGRVGRYIGVDVIAYEQLRQRSGIEFAAADLNGANFASDLGLLGVADAAVAIETIEHLENPRALVRELTRIARPGGLVLVTTPNQLSWLSKMALVVKNEFSAFQEGPGLYPTHITALVASDLRHIGAECGLEDVAIAYSGEGRIPGSGRLYPGWVRRAWPRGASDNVMMTGRRAGG